MRQDRRTAIDLDMAREILQFVDAKIRWYLNSKVLADASTKAEVSKANDAMRSVLHNGTYRLAPEVEEMELRQEDPHRKQRDRAQARPL